MLRRMMLYIILSFLQKNVSFFSGGGPRGKFGQIVQNYKTVHILTYFISYVTFYSREKKGCPVSWG